jgi:hypothetical protein
LQMAVLPVIGESRKNKIIQRDPRL